MYELTGRKRADLLAELHGIDDFDPSDLHLLVAAMEQDAAIICTSNTTDLRQPAYVAPSDDSLYREIVGV